MGYSASRNALDRLNALITDSDRYENSSNVWVRDGKKYFYEIGRENRDGSVTGTVYQIREGNLAYKKGSFKIDSSGKVIRFPHMTKKMKEAATTALPAL